MKNLIFIICLIWISLSNSLAQSISHEFGAVSKEELMLEQYDKDPEASALVLYDIGKAFFANEDNGFNIQFTRTKRIKIFTKAGLDYAEIMIPYYQDGYGKSERVTDIEAFTYNLEFGRIKKTPLDPENIFVEKRSERWLLKKFAMPQVKEGAVIEIKYVLKTPFKYNLPDWEFQDRIPTLYSEYEARMVPFYEYSYIFQGAEKFDHFESYISEGLTRQFGVHEFQDMVYKFVMEDVPAFKDEAYISSINDYIIKLDFQLSKFTNYHGVSRDIITTWPKLNNGLIKHEHFGKYVKASKKAAKEILEEKLVLAGKSDLEKCEAIVNYVKANYTWNGRSTRYASKKAKDFVKEKAGNSADINLFLNGMLRAANFEAYAVLLSTRDHGKIPLNYPFEHFFNEVITIVKIGDNFILTDATEDLMQFNRIPYRCINGKGLIVMEDKEPWVDLSQSIPSVIQESLALEILPEKDSIRGRFSRGMTEYAALSYRSAYQDQKQQINNALLKEGFDQISKIETFNYSNLKAPYLVTFNAQMPIERFENKLFVAPFLNLPLADNLLKQEKRVYPVDMVYQIHNIFKSQIIVPETYTVAKLPENYSFEDDLVQINYWTKEEKGVVNSEGFYYFKKSIYDPSEYARLKSHLDHVVKVFNKKIVFAKKESELVLTE